VNKVPNRGRGDRYCFGPHCDVPYCSVCPENSRNGARRDMFLGLQ
jgi:hypothetical protein